MIVELWRLVVSSTGSILEFIGFILMQKSVKELILKKGSLLQMKMSISKLGSYLLLQ